MSIIGVVYYYIDFTTLPTSAPSFSPTCGIGSYGDESGCEKCPPGTYTSSNGLEICAKCPMNHYSSNYGSSKCTQCTWPFSTYEEGSTKCQAVYLQIHGPLLLTPIVVVASIFMIGLWSVTTNRFSLSLILLFPTVDIHRHFILTSHQIL